MIKFTAQTYTSKGDLIRCFHNGIKFWKVVKVVNGTAYAKPAGNGTDCRVACC
jgi:hypothetical protein